MGKGTFIIATIALGGVGYGLYAWLTPGHQQTEPANETQPPAGSHVVEASPQEAKTIVRMAKFLEAAPPEQLKKIGLAPEAARGGATFYDALLPYTKGAQNGPLIAQMLSPQRPSGGTPDDAKRELSENLANAVGDIQTVLNDLPDHFADERVELLHFLGETALNMENLQAVPDILLRESQRNGAARDPADHSSISQTVALKAYFDLVSDRGKRQAALQAAIDRQSDPIVKDSLRGLERFAQAAPAAPAPAAASAPAAEPPAMQQEPPQEPARDNTDSNRDERDRDRDNAENPPADH